MSTPRRRATPRPADPSTGSGIASSASPDRHRSPRPADRSPARLVTTAVAAAEGLALLGYAGSIAYVVASQGVNGPAAVASPTGVAVEIVTYVLFGAGLLLVAFGRWRERGWATIPFVLAQLLALTVSIPLATGVSEGRLTGYVLTAAAVVGLGALFFGPRDPALADTDGRERSPSA